MLVLLAGTHLYFTIRLGFIQRKLPDGLRRSLSSAGSGGLSPYEALSTALAATIGTGNIILTRLLIECPPVCMDDG